MTVTKFFPYCKSFIYLLKGYLLALSLLHCKEYLESFVMKSLILSDADALETFFFPFKQK